MLGDETRPCRAAVELKIGQLLYLMTDVVMPTMWPASWSSVATILEWYTNPQAFLQYVKLLNAFGLFYYFKGLGFRIDTKKTCERDWTPCSKFVSLSRHGRKHNICITGGPV